MSRCVRVDLLILMPDWSRAGWLSERRRGLTSAAVAIVAAVVAVVLVDTPAPGDAAVFTLFPYLLVYLVVSIVAFGGAQRAELQAWAHRESRGTFLQRYILGTAPGPGTSLFIASASLIVAFVWLPGESDAFPRPARVALAVALVAGAWATVAVSFAIAYLGDDVEHADTLVFPATPQPVWSDYLYFAVSVMGTIGTTDVQIVASTTRRSVTVNTIIAFVFNTVIVATLVTALAGL